MQLISSDSTHRVESATSLQLDGYSEHFHPSSADQLNGSGEMCKARARAQKQFPRRCIASDDGTAHSWTTVARSRPVGRDSVTAT